jgi:uncharacterized membrane protein
MTEIPTENASQNPLKLQLEETHYSVVPDSRVTILIGLVNQGDEEDHFEVSVRGIPLDWVSIETPVVRLNPGEKADVPLVIEAPPASQVRAGQYPLTLMVLSQSSPSQKVETELTLTVAAFEVQGRIGILMESVQFSVSPGSSAVIPIVLLNQGLVEDNFKLSPLVVRPGIPTRSIPLPFEDPGG